MSTARDPLVSVHAVAPVESSLLKQEDLPKTRPSLLQLDDCAAACIDMTVPAEAMHSCLLNAAGLEGSLPASISWPLGGHCVFRADQTCAGTDVTRLSWSRLIAAGRIASSLGGNAERQS